MPNSNPTETENTNASAIELKVMMVDHPASMAIARDSTNPTTIPISPPENEISTASTRNCRTMSLWRAPMARRTPISRVRSRMLASMMFMIPIPPTSSEIEAIATMTMSKMRCVRRCSASNSAGTITWKSPASRCDAFKMLRTTSDVSVVSSAVLSCR